MGYESPSVSLTQSLHKCGTCVFVFVCVCRYKLWLYLLVICPYSLNLLCFWWHGNCELTLQGTGRVSDVTLSCVVAVDIHTARIHCCNTHTHHLKAVTVLLCLYLPPRLGIPGNAHRVYWHSCLIACSIVHSVRANPLISLRVSLSHSTEHQTYYPHSHSAWSTARQTHTSIRRRHTCKTHTRTPAKITVRRWYLKRYTDAMTLFMWPVYWFVNTSVNHDVSLSFGKA